MDGFWVGSVVVRANPVLLGRGSHAITMDVFAGDLPAALRVITIHRAADLVASTVRRYALLSEKYAGFVPQLLGTEEWASWDELPPQVRYFVPGSNARYLGVLMEQGTEGTLSKVFRPSHDPWWAMVAMRLLGFLAMAQREVGFEHRDIKAANIVFERGMPLLIDYDMARFEVIEQNAEPLRAGTASTFPPEVQRVPVLEAGSGDADHITAADALAQPVGAFDNWSLGITLLDAMLGGLIAKQRQERGIQHFDYSVDHFRILRTLTAELLQALHDPPANDSVFVADVRESVAALPLGAQNLFRRLLARDPRERAMRNNACAEFRTNPWLRTAPGYDAFMYDYGYRIAAPFPNIRWSVSFRIGAPLRCGACGQRDRLHMCAATGLVVCGERCWDAIKTESGFI
jgi:serine/threonine protein kinase